MKTVSRFIWPIYIVMMGVLLGCPVPQALEETPKSYTTETNEITGKDFYLYVPSTYDSQKKYPLVITLHGTPPWDTAFLQIHEWKALAEKKQFIVAVPTLRSTQGILPVIESLWLKDLQKDEETILTLRRQLLSCYSIDEKQILLTGFSAGGYPMYYTGLRHPDLFHMLVARACNSDARIFEKIDLDDKTRRIPVMLFVGVDDYGLQKQTWAAFRWLRRHGWDKHACRMKETKGGHLRRPEYAYDVWQPTPPK